MDKSYIALILIGGSLGWIAIGGAIMILTNYPMIDQVRFVYTPSIIIVLLGIVLHVMNMSKRPTYTGVKQ